MEHPIPDCHPDIGGKTGIWALAAGRLSGCTNEKTRPPHEGRAVFFN
jgi:hypothetical protein